MARLNPILGGVLTRFVKGVKPQQRDESAGVRPPRRAYAQVGLAVFTAGGVALATELAAARAVAPDFGSSTASWAGVIGVVLGALMLGSLLGGRIASTEASLIRTIVSLLLAASALIAAPAFAGADVIAQDADISDPLPFWMGSAVAVSLLYAPSVVVLGAVTPVATRMLSHHVAEAGRAAGRVYALSALGSLVGVFGAGLVTLPLLGTRATLLGGAIALTSVGLLLAGTRHTLRGQV